MVCGEEEKQEHKSGLQGEGRRSKQRSPPAPELHKTWPPTDQFICHVVKCIDLHVKPTVLLTPQRNTNNISHLCHTV